MLSIRTMSKPVNSLGVYYNKYMDETFKLPHIDYRKDNTLTDNDMATFYGKKSSIASDSQITGRYLYADGQGNDKKEYPNPWNLLIKPKEYVNVLGARLLA